MDVRDLILKRLVELAKTLVPADHVFRNVASVPRELAPAIVILDGDEEVREESYGRGRPANAPMVVDLLPEIYFLAAAPSEGVGDALSAGRKAILKAVLEDQTLLGLCLRNDVRYLGMVTGLGSGRSMAGETHMRFSFAFVLRPSLLA